MSAFISRDELAALIGVHSETIKRAEKSGKIPAYHLGRRTIRYKREDVTKWLEGTRYAAKPTTA